MSQGEVSSIRARSRTSQSSERSDSWGLSSRCLARMCLVALFTAASVVPPFGTAEANNGKGPKMPAPTAVFKDADGKTIGQLVGFWTSGGMYVNPLALFNFDGDLALVEVGPKYLLSLSARNVQFTGSNCTGQAFLTRYLPGNFVDMTKTLVAVVGPDSETGVYRVFKANSYVPAETTIASVLVQRGGYCINNDEPVAATAYPAEEILPNPFGDFHGPTAEHPERTLTLEGGTRY